MFPTTKNMRLKVTQPSSRNADYDRFPLKTSQPQKLAKQSSVMNITSITGFTTKSPKGDSDSDYVVFVNKIQFLSNKVCCKVYLRENFQRQIVV